MTKLLAVILYAALAAVSITAAGQGGQFQRHSACPDLGCILPPDGANFLQGAKFDVRVEVHAENYESPNQNFELTIEKLDKANRNASKDAAIEFSKYTKIKRPNMETWSFWYFKDAEAFWAGMDGAPTTTQVNVASRIWRKVQLKKAGDYKVVLRYNNGKTTEAVWHVLPVQKPRAKNVILFIGDGMTTPMITAARHISRRRLNGLFQSHLHMDQFPNMGHVMTHSLASLITDSANSMSAYTTGHKTVPQALGVYPDTSSSPLDDPRVELLAELLRRRPSSRGGRGGVGIVTTAPVQDATPAAMFGHTRMRSQAGELMEQMIRGENPVVADVYLGGGGEWFHSRQGGKSLNGTDYYEVYQKEQGYTVVNNRTSLLAYKGPGPLLGIFNNWQMNVWLDRHVYRDNLISPSSDPQGRGRAPLDQPDLHEMVIKGLDVLERRYHDAGWFMMAEAASIDSMMHSLDFDRALADVLELDSTIGKTKAWLKRYGLEDDTLILVTADHGHSFDVYGSVDTEFFNSADKRRGGEVPGVADLERRNAIGTYAHAGWPSYEDKDGDGFPDEWKVRYTLAAGVVGAPAHREQFQVHPRGVRNPTQSLENSRHRYKVHVPNPDEDPNGMFVSGVLPVAEPVGVHSMQDVPIFAQGPGSERFRGVLDNTQVFHHIAALMGLGETEDD